MTQPLNDSIMNKVTRQQLIDQLCEEYVIDGDFEYTALEEYTLNVHIIFCGGHEIIYFREI